MHVNTGYLDAALPVVRHHVEVFGRALDAGVDAIVAPSGSCVGCVRHQHAMVARRARRRGAGARGRAGRRADLRALRAARRRARGDRRRRLLPAPRHLPPDVPLAADAARRRQAAAAAARGARAGPRGAARRRGLLRVRRHVRGEERRDLDGDAGRQDGERALDSTAEVCTAGDSSCLMHIGGGLSRLRSGRADGAPGRDPGQYRLRRPLGRRGRSTPRRSAA